VFWCWSSFTFGVFFVLLIISALNFLCLNMVQQALELGTSVSGPQDFLFINWAVMSLAIVWDRSYILYLAIPAYLGYQYGGVAKGYFFPAKAPEMVKGEADLKREAKKERQAARQAKLQGR
jgi:hypothetical protein